ncbi:unnamed protein product [Calicophoron daubneyi]|uniref:Dynein assembly factor 1, axonemal homolog n=1 Tax=Calicophoron daubneyi TaxID=300641 RepID=A0AAV2TNZ0_CALDB
MAQASTCSTALGPHEIFTECEAHAELPVEDISPIICEHIKCSNTCEHNGDLFHTSSACVVPCANDTVIQKTPSSDRGSPDGTLGEEFAELDSLTDKFCSSESSSKAKNPENLSILSTDLSNLPYPPGYSILRHKDVIAEEKASQKEAEDPRKTGPRMTKEFLKKHCAKHKLYQTPHLNDILYLHYNGFPAIENLEEYTGLRCLFLEVNGIEKISGLENQTEMRSLYMARNLIRRIENLDHMKFLDTLDLSHNMISKIENLDMLPNFTRLIVAHNRLTEVDDIRHLVNCPQLSVLDIQHNRIKDPSVVEEVFAKMPALRVLYNQGNGFVREVKNYRKNVIHQCKDLTYLDERPVFPRDRACSEAFYEGGPELESQVRQQWNEAEQKKIADSCRWLTEKRKKIEARRREKELREAAEAAGLPSDNIHVNPGDIDWLYGDQKPSTNGETNEEKSTKQTEESLSGEPVEGATSGAGDVGPYPRTKPRDGPLYASQMIQEIYSEFEDFCDKRKKGEESNGRDYSTGEPTKLGEKGSEEATVNETCSENEAEFNEEESVHEKTLSLENCADEDERTVDANEKETIETDVLENNESMTEQIDEANDSTDDEEPPTLRKELTVSSPAADVLCKAPEPLEDVKFTTDEKQTEEAQELSPPENETNPITELVGRVNKEDQPVDYILSSECWQEESIFASHPQNNSLLDSGFMSQLLITNNSNDVREEDSEKSDSMKGIEVLEVRSITETDENPPHSKECNWFSDTNGRILSPHEPKKSPMKQPLITEINETVISDVSGTDSPQSFGGSEPVIQELSVHSDDEKPKIDQNEDLRKSAIRKLPLIIAERNAVTEQTEDSLEEDIMLRDEQSAFTNQETSSPSIADERHLKRANVGAKGEDTDSGTIEIDYGDHSESFEYGKNMPPNYIKDIDPKLLKKIMETAANAGRRE